MVALITADDQEENNELGVEDAGERWKGRIRPRGMNLEEKHKPCGDKFEKT